MIQKVAIIGVLIALVSTPIVIDRLPLPLLQWIEASVNTPELLNVIDGSVTQYQRSEGNVVDVERVYPIPGRTDAVVVLLPNGVWLKVLDSAFDRFIRE